MDRCVNGLMGLTSAERLALRLLFEETKLNVTPDGGVPVCLSIRNKDSATRICIRLPNVYVDALAEKLFLSGDLRFFKNCESQYIFVVIVP